MGAEPGCGTGTAAGAWMKHDSLLSRRWQLGTAGSTREGTQAQAARLLEREKDIFIPAAKTLLYFGFS